MKLIDYIHTNGVLSDENSLRLTKYEQLISILINNNSNFVYLHLSEDLLEQYNIVDVFNSIQNKIILISSGDIDFPPPKKPYSYHKYFDKSKLPDNYLEVDYYEKIHTDLIQILENNNLYVISFSVSINHPRIINYPLGIYPKFNFYHLKYNPKNILCYANFGIHYTHDSINYPWYGNQRGEILDIISTKDFILKENITMSTGRTVANLDNFYNKISHSKFALCPRGCGIDTYRLWDCIYLGCIPIVELYGGHEQYRDLPILFINNHKDYEMMTEEYLNQVYEDFLLKEFNYDKCTFQYWVNIINQIKI